jgi:LuxR family maltose regulon positive regulatory protein
LEQLERANLFTVPLDDEGIWYRYHPLFVEVARERLRGAVSANELAALHQNASLWYEQQGLVIDAVQHALVGGNALRAAALIECHGLSLASSGSAPLVRGWLDALPDALVRARPALCLYDGLALMATKQLDAAEGRLLDAERGITTAASDDRDLNMLAQIALARAAIARCTGDLARCMALSQRVMLLAPQLSATVQAEATLNLARAYQLNGDAGLAAEQLAEEAIALLRRSGNTSWLLAGIVNLARLRTVQGHLRAALATYAQATEMASGSGQPPDRAAYHTGLAAVLHERNQLAPSTDELHQALALMQAGHLVDADIITQQYLTLACLRQACGDREGALAALDTFADLARQSRFVLLLIERGAAMRARLHLAQGNLLSAARWADTADIHLQDPVDFTREDAYLTFARVRIAQWQGESSSSSVSAILDLLDRLLVAAEAGGRVGSVIAILIVRALALQAQNNLSGALVALARALVLAAPEGYIRSFVDAGAPMLALLREAYSRSIVPDYVEQLLHAFPQTTNDEVPIQRSSFIAQPLEALTTREREVLQLIAEGASNAEIAGKLTLSLGTVKRYTNNIFGKLNVQSRTQAVLQAHRLRLL